MTNKEAKEKLYMEWQKFLEDNIDYAGVSEAYKMAFKALEQEPKTGHWKTDRQGDMQCSRCEHQRPYFIDYTSEGCKVHGELTPFCPNCGAKMESEDNK